MTTTGSGPTAPGNDEPNDAGGAPADDRRAKLLAALQARQGKPRVCPVSYADRRMWFMCQLVEESWFYHSAAMAELTNVDVDALRRSFDALIVRHETLRTSFRFDADRSEPVQVIHAPGPVDLAALDLTTELPDATKDEREAAIRERLPDLIRDPFDLEEGPLFRAYLLRTSDRAHVLVLVIHHLVFDGWSMNILLRDLTELYEAEITGAPAKLPPLMLQYADVAMLQRKQLQGETLDKLLGYWREQLADLPVLELPTDRARPPRPSHEGRYASIRIPDEVSATLDAICAQTGASFFMAGLAAFALLLHRYCGQDDVVIGTPIANRNRRETENLIGCFVNTLVLRADFSGDPTFRALLEQVRNTCLGAYEHEDLPFEMLVEALDPRRDLSRNPLFQVMFQLTQTGDRQAAEPTTNLRIRPMPLASNAVRFDIEINAERRFDGELVFNVSYRPDLFDASTIDRMLSHLVRLLEGAVGAPDEPLSRIAILDDDDRRRMLVEWNPAATDSAPAWCLHERFETHAARTPDATAIVHGEREISYGELNRRANRLAHHLMTLGVGPDTMVGLCVKREPDMLVGMLAILKAGGAYVAIDPRYPASRIAFMLEDARTPVLVTQADLVEHLPPHDATTVRIDPDQPAFADAAETDPASGVRPDNLAYVIYTSGSTGQPKGVAIAHRNAAALLEWAPSVFTPEDLRGVLASTSICFDLSVFEIFLTLTQGGTIILANHALTLADLPARDRVTLVNTVPSAAAELARSGALPASVRTISLAGEPLLPALVDRLYACGVSRVLDLYGPSETTTYSTCALRSPDTPYTIGRPIPNEQIYLLDRAGQPVPVGVVGEIFIGGAGVTRGYHGAPAKTAERFVPDPFGRAGGRLYRTGDLARYRPNGDIVFLGRNDHQVKLRGFRIELGEIETALLSHAAIVDTAVVVREDTGDARLIAYLVTANGAAPATGELREHLGDRLPDYMVPSAFVTLDALPRTPGGKVDRAALPAPAITGGAASARPETPLQIALAEVWQAVLGVEAIGLDDNFFDLGGHSLLTVDVVRRMEERTGVRLSVGQLVMQNLGQVANAYETAIAERDASGNTQADQSSQERRGTLSALRRLIRRR